MDLVKQRQQAGHGKSLSEIARGLRSTHSSIFFASYLASFMRDIMHSSLQFPMYEYLKLALARWRRASGRDETDGLPTWQAASCGSVAGVLSAVCTTPLDLLRTRLNLRGSHEDCTMPKGIRPSPPALALLREEVLDVYRSRGVRGFFAGGLCRAAWMGLGGFIFLGSFELAKKHLLGEGATAIVDPALHAAASPTSPPPSPPPPSEAAPALAASAAAPVEAAGPAPAGDLPPQPPTPGPPAALGGAGGGRDANSVEAGPARQLGPQPPASVSMIAGFLAGMAVDIPLHPLDTVKTRMQAPEGFAAAGGFRSPWSGLSAVVVVSVPGSAIFFVVYEYARHFLERNVPPALQDKRYAIGRDAVAASLADVSACVVRVPCEVLKQRMQAIGPMATPPTFRATVARVSSEGLRGFFAGFGATAMREVPFALIQMPLFEELKHRHPWAASARARGDTAHLGFIGMQSGCVAGMIAGVATTPLDVAKTHIILTENRANRRGLYQTMNAIRAECGMAGLFKGGVPRAAHCGLGGALWLGAFEWSKLLWGCRPYT
mmetsp:Transcript_91248/g.295006  ORF Transcript_91248/g.295006 Transcript_91248/m.295006 type:complete len:548 (+) Transcript_91248:482-2125(+)